jgi:hypothetical protein
VGSIVADAVMLAGGRLSDASLVCWALLFESPVVATLASCCCVLPTVAEAEALLERDMVPALILG